jgi:hypothetical protein
MTSLKEDRGDASLGTLRKSKTAVEIVTSRDRKQDGTLFAGVAQAQPVNLKSVTSLSLPKGRSRSGHSPLGPPPWADVKRCSAGALGHG